MIKSRAWPVRAIYMLLAAALVISLIITTGPAFRAEAAPGGAVKAEWDRVSTPSMEGWVLAPQSAIRDYAVASEGEVAYAIVDGWNAKEEEHGSWLLKSTNHAATWSDITSGVKKEIDKKDLGVLRDLEAVATDGEDPDFVAVALWVSPDNSLRVLVSNDGGKTFEAIAGAVDLGQVFAFAVSPKVADVRDVAIAGLGTVSNLWRSRVTGKIGGAWANATHATEYAGWDADADDAVVAVKFPLTWAVDATVLAVSVTSTTAHLQSGHWGSTPRWNVQAGFAPAVELVEGVIIDWLLLGGLTAGITLPTDYEGTSVPKRESWVWVNYYDPEFAGDPPVGTIFWVSDADAIPVTQQITGQPWLTNVSYWGNIVSGKAIAGVLGTGNPRAPSGLYTEPCQGVQVYRYLDVKTMDICCPRWERACKPPTGSWAMEAMYVTADKAYAVALKHQPLPGNDETAWSFSLDNGDTWNQLSLIDTQIDYLSDVAVSPDCNKTMLVSINEHGCDSVWYRAEDLSHYGDEYNKYSGQWLRTWNRALEGQHPLTGGKHGLLRLAPEEENGKTVYLVDVGNDRVYWNEMQTLACWSHGTAPIDIIDLALKDAMTPYALGLDGDVAMSDDFAKTHRWQAKVASGVDAGWTIAVWGDDILVGGQEGDVAYSDDGGENFTKLAKKTTIEGLVTVAFDSYYGVNDAIYAAVARFPEVDGGIYHWIVGDSTSWTDLSAEPSTFQLTGSGSEEDSNQVAYTGLVLDNADGNPMTGPATGGVLYASYVGELAGTQYTGVARALTPIMEVDACAICPVEWDYLVVGYAGIGVFNAAPQALKICGCLTPNTYTRLFAIDRSEYEMAKGRHGTVWTFEDCYSKKAVTLKNPADGYLVPSDPCAGCWNAPFTINWDRVCDACVYEYQFASDADFENIVWDDIVLGSPAHNPTELVPQNVFLPGETYYWRVRARQAGTDQWIRSWWSQPRTVTVGPALGTGILLVAPEVGATNVARTKIAFIWDSVATFDSYDFELSEFADLSSPVDTAQGLTVKAYTYTGAALKYDTPYYWRVTAIQDGAPASQAMGTFRVMPEPPDPPPPPPDPVTPPWVWVVIAIGAVLVIVVIVLIFRTRRV